MSQKWEDAHKLCEFILIYEPNNKEANEFLPLIKQKLYESQKKEVDDESSDDSEDDDDSDDNDEESDDEDSSEEDTSDSEEDDDNDDVEIPNLKTKPK